MPRRAPAPGADSSGDRGTSEATPFPFADQAKSAVENDGSRNDGDTLEPDELTKLRDNYRDACALLDAGALDLAQCGVQLSSAHSRVRELERLLGLTNERIRQFAEAIRRRPGPRPPDDCEDLSVLERLAVAVRILRAGERWADRAQAMPIDGEHCDIRFAREQLETVVADLEALRP